ncbi:MAG: hypothetical protein ACQKBV_01850, partial [Puniceicoccales bacterium]
TIAPVLTGTFQALGRTVSPAFQLLAERYLSKDYAPDAVADKCGVPAATIRRIAAELAKVAHREVREPAPHAANRRRRRIPHGRRHRERRLHHHHFAQRLR